MTLSVKHAFSSPKTASADPTQVDGPKWNAEHELTMATGKILGRRTGGTGAVEELPDAMVPSGGTTGQLLRKNSISDYDYNWATPGEGESGSGTVTSISSSGGLESDAGGAITASGGVRQAITTVVETTTSRAIGVTDRAKLIEFTNASAKSATLEQAQNSNRATMGFTGWFCWVLNSGADTLTITPATSTIAGAASLSLANTEGAFIVSDGTNYKAIKFQAGGAVNIYDLISALPAETAPSISDEIEIQDMSVPAARRMTLADLFKVIASLTALTAVDAADSLPVYDASASSTKVATVSNVFAALNALTEDTAPSMTADYMVTYDASGAAAKKALLGKVGVGKYSFYVDAASMKSTTTGSKTGATLTANRDLGANDVGGSVLSFSATAKTHAWFRYAMPKGWDQGTFTARFYWTAATGTGTVEWEIAAAILRDDDITGTSLGAAVTVTDALLATDDAHITAETGAITAGGTAANPCLVLFQIARDGTVGNTDDTFSAAALLLGVEISYTRSANTDD